MDTIQEMTGQINNDLEQHRKRINRAREDLINSIYNIYGELLTSYFKGVEFDGKHFIFNTKEGGKRKTILEVRFNRGVNSGLYTYLRNVGAKLEHPFIPTIYDLLPSQVRMGNQYTILESDSNLNEWLIEADRSFKRDHIDAPLLLPGRE